MNRMTWLFVTGFALATAVGVAGRSPDQSRQAARPAPSSRAGLFTEAQATRGEAVYAQSCASCHGAALTGGAAPPLVGPAFERSWSGGTSASLAPRADARTDPRVTLDDLFFVLRTTMPPNATSTVSVPDRTAVFAFILKRNGYTAGQTTLTADMPQLAQQRLVFTATGPEPARPAPPAFVPGTAGAVPGTSGPDQATLNAAAESTDWLFHNHDYAGTRYSPLDAITVENASRLAPVCAFQMGERDNFQTGPVVHQGTMYVTTMTATIALDAATCRVKWRHSWQPRDDTGWQRNRGVAIKDGRIVRATPDGYLLGLSTETGALLWARQVSKPSEGETITMAPMIFEDLVLIGPAGSENNVQGWVGAFRVTDGSPVWRFNTVPKPGEPGYDSWKNPPRIPVGGGAVWTSFSLDVVTGDLHIAVTNPAPDLPIHIRQGDNLYTNSIVVLDVRTGKLRWHRQLIKNDSHDWDLTHASPLFTTTLGGAVRRLVTTVGKDGMLRAIDRDSKNIVYETAVTTRKNAEIPVGLTPLHACPGLLGGVEWNGPAFNPGTNLLYVPAVDWCATFVAFEQVRHIPGKLYMGGDVNQDPVATAHGWVTAVDATTGAVRWKFHSPRPMVAAVTTTAGRVVFAGELTGDFVTLDAQTGDVLYRFNTGGPMGGGIATYATGGRQYVAAASGSPSSFWVDQNPGSPTIFVFALPR